jgi:BioD-like N-terminal domain of phosphotransacetylase
MDEHSSDRMGLTGFHGNRRQIMTLQDVCAVLKAEVHCGSANLSREAESGYASDLLSEVMAGAKVGQLWFTVQTHPNIAAVALLANLAAVVITGGHKPEAATVAKAEAEGLPILSTDYQTYEALQVLFKAGF